MLKITALTETESLIQHADKNTSRSKNGLIPVDLNKTWTNIWLRTWF